MKNIRQIAIVGTGLLGGSIGLGLRKAGFNGQIVGVGRRRTTLDTALEIGCIDEVSLDLVQTAAVADLIVLATPLGTFQPLLEQIAAANNQKLVITDVGSTKQLVMQQARQLLPNPAMFVGSHPMAGGEMHGPTRARPDLFDGRPCIVVSEGCDENAVNVVEEFWKMLRVKIVRMSAAEHDRKTAAISHWPHAVAALLVELAQKADGLDIASTGFTDVTRVASGDPDVWADIFSTNRESLLEAMDAHDRLLAQFREILQKGDHQEMVDFLSNAKNIRDDWVGRPAYKDGANNEI